MPDLQTAVQRGCVGLFIANPGHEVPLHGWLQRDRPTVFVLTDGSGQHGFARLGSTTRILAQSRALPGGIYGRFSDSDVYRAILDRDLARFAAVVQELADWLAHHPVRYLVADAAEGVDPAQDLCRTMAGVAVELTRALSGRAVPLYEHVVNGDRQSCVAGQCHDSTRWRLSDEALQRKVTAAHHYRELATEIDRAFERDGAAAYRVECLHHVSPRRPWTPAGGAVPCYEHRRASRLTSGKGSPIRYAEHIAPLESDLWAMASAPERAVAGRRSARTCSDLHVRVEPVA